MEFPLSSVPTNKTELQKSINLAFDKILADYATIPVEITRKVGVTGNIKGTEISVCDTIAYLIGWGKLVLKWYELKSKNQAVNFPETGYKWNELGKLEILGNCPPCQMNHFFVPVDKLGRGRLSAPLGGIEHHSKPARSKLYIIQLSLF